MAQGLLTRDNLEMCFKQQINSPYRIEKIISQIEITEQNIRNTTTKCINPLFKPIESQYYYIENTETLNWYGAAQKCVALGGHLLNLQSAKQFDLLKRHLRSDVDYWTDINDLSTTDDWVSLTSGHQATLLIWIDGEPKTVYKSNHCVYLQGTKEWKMKNDECESKRRFICQHSA